MTIDKSRPVLVADDDEYFRLALATLLKGPLGFSNIIETASLDEALDKLAASAAPVGLALFDLFMPGMNGPSTLGAVRDCYPDVRVAVVSASQSRQDVMTALDIGVHGYIPKGFGPNELVRALDIIINGDIFVPAFLSDVTSIAKRAQTKPTGVSGPIELSRAGASTREELDSSALLASISPRQRDVLGLLVKGYSNKQIAKELSLGEGTIKIHVATLLRNLGVSNRTGAAAAGVRLFRSA